MRNHYVTILGRPKILPGGRGAVPANLPPRRFQKKIDCSSSTTERKHEKMQNLRRKCDALRLPLKAFSLNKGLSLRDQVRMEFPLVSDRDNIDLLIHALACSNSSSLKGCSKRMVYFGQLHIMQTMPYKASISRLFKSFRAAKAPSWKTSRNGTMGRVRGSAADER